MPRPPSPESFLPLKPHWFHVLLSLADREEPVIRSFFIRDGEVVEEELTIE